MNNSAKGDHQIIDIDKESITSPNQNIFNPSNGKNYIIYFSKLKISF